MDSKFLNWFSILKLSYSLSWTNFLPTNFLHQFSNFQFEHRLLQFFWFTFQEEFFHQPLPIVLSIFQVEFFAPIFWLRVFSPTTPISSWSSEQSFSNKFSIHTSELLAATIGMQAKSFQDIEIAQLFLYLPIFSQMGRLNCMALFVVTKPFGLSPHVDNLVARPSYGQAARPI